MSKPQTINKGIDMETNLQYCPECSEYYEVGTDHECDDYITDTLEVSEDEMPKALDFND